MPENDLLGRVVKALNDNKGQWTAISQASGVPYFTISKVATGATENPRWETVRKLASHFGFLEAA